MVLLLQTFNKLCSKLENHHHRRRHESQALPDSYLLAFQSEVSSCLNQLSASSGSRLSFQWLLQLLQVLPIVHRAFAKLVVNLEYPISEWGDDLVDGHLNYSLNLLDLFNYISFSLSQLGQSRLLLSHALNLVVQSSPSMAIDRLKPIQLKTNYKALEIKEPAKALEIKEPAKDQRKGSSGQERAIRQALVTMEGIGYWICGTVVSGCGGDSTAYLDTRKSAAAGVPISSLQALDSSIFEVMSEKGSVPKEVEEVNNAAAQVGAGAEEMRRRLESLAKQVESLGKEVDSQFSEALAGRSRLLDVFRHPKH